MNGHESGQANWQENRQENWRDNGPARLRASLLSRRRALALLAAPFAAPILSALSGTSRANAATPAQSVPVPAGVPVIRAHPAASPFEPHAKAAPTGFALSVAGPGDAPLRLLPDAVHVLRVVNDLPHAIIPRLRGVAARAAAPINPGTSADLVFDGLRVGTHLVELRGIQAAKADAEIWPTNATSPVLPLIVAPPNGVAGPDALMRDEVLLIEEWPATDAGAGAGDPGTASQAIPLTANRLPRADLAAPGGGTLRLRLINATPRRMLSFLLPDWSPSVIAIDGEEAEPFPPRDRQIVLAPGNRMDVLLNVPKDIGPAPVAAAAVLVHDGIKARTIAQINIVPPDKLAPAPPQTGIAPAPSGNSLQSPERPNLTGAQRVELAFMPPASGHTANAGPWRRGDAPAPASPAFTTVRGRTVSLALRNNLAAPIAIHLNGHRARLLDRLDDGWKPFWLDTVAVEPNETIRLAFVTSNVGTWDIEATLLAGAPPSASAEKPSTGANGGFRFTTTFSVT